MKRARETKVEVDKLGEQELREFTSTLLEKISLQEQRIAELTRMIFGRRSEKSRYMDPATLLRTCPDARS